jgi:hypothetical protein
MVIGLVRYGLAAILAAILIAQGVTPRAHGRPTARFRPDCAQTMRGLSTRRGTQRGAARRLFGRPGPMALRFCGFVSAIANLKPASTLAPDDDVAAPLAEIRSLNHEYRHH